MGSTARPAPDVEDRPDLLGPLGHVQEPESPRLLGCVWRVLGDAGACIVDRKRDPAIGGPVANHDRRLAVLDGIRERLLGDAEDRQLHLRRVTGVVGPLQADLAAGEPLDPENQPVEGRSDAEVVEDGQAQIATDRAQLVGDGPADLRSLGVARRLEPANQQGQLLECVVVDVGGQPRSLGLGGGDDEIALQGRPGGQPAAAP